MRLFPEPIAAGPRFKFLTAAFLIAWAALFLFTGLGDSALWDDEATTALFGLSVWKTGDAHALLDGNLIAYEDGKELWNLRNRFMPPLPFYVTAPFVGFFGRNAWAARLPFAIMGFCAVVLFIVWLWSTEEKRLGWVLFTSGILLNVPFFLYSRQCRWYAPALLFSWCVVFAYLQKHKSRLSMSLAGLASVCLMASNYMSYLALYGCLALDYLTWERKIRPLRAAEWSSLILPQILLGGMLFAFWTPYPLIGQILDPAPSPQLVGRLTLLWIYLREYNACEFGALTIIIASPLIGFFTGDRWLVRGFCLWIAYLSIIVLIAPRPEAEAAAVAGAPIRYMFPLIPLGVFLMVRTIRGIPGKKPIIALLIALMVFGTNFFHLGPFAGLGHAKAFQNILPDDAIHSTPLNFIRELIHPPQRTYDAVSQWIHRHVAPGQSLWVVPGYAAYPLMFHAPHVVYAWQLFWPPSPQFRDLDAIHFIKKKWPDTVIVFGPDILWIGAWLMENGYALINSLDFFFYDLVRPELLDHAFQPLTKKIPDDQRVFVFMRHGTDG